MGVGALVGVPHPRWVESPAVVVVAAGGQPAPTKSELVAHCRGRLAGYKKPSAVYLIDQLPRSAAGKSPSGSCAPGWHGRGTKLKSCNNL